MPADGPFPTLFSPVQIGSVTVRNRVAMTPMATRMATDGLVEPRDVAWYEARARGGVGLIITGGAVVSESSVLRGHVVVEAHRPEGAEWLAKRAEAVKAHGATVFGQILHLGREATGAQIDLPQPAPSAVRSPREESVPYELTRDEIRELVVAFGDAAATFQAAGYDGIELHAAHGYLMAQFLSPISNRRDDEYGGATVVDRMRFLEEVVDTVRDRCGDTIPIGVRMSVDEEVPGGLGPSDTLRVVERLQAKGLVQYVSLTLGQRSAYVKDTSYPHGVAVERAATVKAGCDLPVLVAGRFTEPELAEAVLQDGKADLIGLGRALIADPDWAGKAAAGEDRSIRPCVGFAQDCRLSLGGATCAVNAYAGRELEWGRQPVTAGPSRRRVVIVGGGPGGLEAARLLGGDGHDVVLYEQDEELGGQVLRTSRAPYREDFVAYLAYLEHEARRAGVDVRLGTAATVDTVMADAPGTVVVATGAVPAPPEFPGAELDTVVPLWDLLDGRERPLGSRVAVVDDGTGFWPAYNAADLLVARGVTVELVTPAPAPALRIPHESVAPLHRRLRGGGARYHTFSDVRSAAPGVVTIVDVLTGDERDLEVDAVVVHTAALPRDGLLRALRERGVDVHGVGDCLSPRRITPAVFDANRVHRSLALAATA